MPDNHPGLRRQAYEQYIKHIHHTTAMEGNTFTLSQTRSFVENRIVINGKSIIEHNEILGMEAAMHFLNSSLLRRVGKFNMHDITDIHKRVLGYVDPFGAGNFRTTQVGLRPYFYQLYCSLFLCFVIIHNNFLIIMLEEAMLVILQSFLLLLSTLEICL